jgi:hypothetical protein
VRAALLALPMAPACGVIKRPDRDLVVIWVDGFLEGALVEQALRGRGDVIDWGASIDCAVGMTWEPWFGEPYTIGTGESAPIEQIPAWLKRLQELQP